MQNTLGTICQVKSIMGKKVLKSETISENNLGPELQISGILVSRIQNIFKENLDIFK